jgi:hypothetical protein
MGESSAEFLYCAPALDFPRIICYQSTAVRSVSGPLYVFQFVVYSNAHFSDGSCEVFGGKLWGSRNKSKTRHITRRPSATQELRLLCVSICHAATSNKGSPLSHSWALSMDCAVGRAIRGGARRAPRLETRLQSRPRDT